LNFIQRSSKDYVNGYISNFIPALLNNEKIMKVALPIDYGEAEVIRLIIVCWMRKNQLKIIDNEDFIEKYWNAIRIQE